MQSGRPVPGIGRLRVTGGNKSRCYGPYIGEVMKILIINPYDQKTTQSNPGLLSVLQLLDRQRIDYAISVAGPAFGNDPRHIALPQDPAAAISQLAAHINTHKSMHLVAIDPEGAALAQQLLASLNAHDLPCSYISYEILFRNEMVSNSEVQMKEQELAYLRHSSSVLIQDEVRGRIFCDETGFDSGKLFYAPVAPLAYLGKSAQPDQVKAGLGLPPDKKILIYTGSLSAYAKPDWWIRIAENLPEDYIFLFTCYDSTQLRNPDLARIGKVLVAGGNAMFLTRELPVDRYLQLLQACDAGIVLYRPVYTHWMNGANIRQIGLSSGKFSYYIACGLGVICDYDQEVYRRLATDYPVVQTISRPEEVAARLVEFEQLGSASVAVCNDLFQQVLNPVEGINNYLAALG
jgi:hypothetical protein